MMSIHAVFQMRVRELYNDALSSNVKLLDWVSDIERRLGSEQPIKEETKPLKQQASEHKVGIVLLNLQMH